jgi:hypothetical protein
MAISAVLLSMVWWSEMPCGRVSEWRGWEKSVKMVVGRHTYTSNYLFKNLKGMTFPG